MPDGKHENNLRANEVNIKQTGSWECLHVLLNMHKLLHSHSFAANCLLIAAFTSLLGLSCSGVLRHCMFPLQESLMLHRCLTDLVLLPSGQQLESSSEQKNGTKDGSLPS